MNKWFSELRYSLPAQMVSSFVVLIVLTAATVGLPAIWIIRDQLERQAWALVDQGRHTTETLIADEQADLANLAILTAQRPTLVEMIEQGDQAEFEVYLNTLLTGADLDLLLVCDANQDIVARSGEAAPGETCANSEGTHFYHALVEPVPGGWLISAQPIPYSGADLTVVVGKAIDNDFAAHLRFQTGLEQTLLFDGEIIATSLPDSAQATEIFSKLALDGASSNTSGLGETFFLSDTPYYSQLIALSDPQLQSMVSLSVSEIANTQRKLTLTMFAGIFVIATIGSAFGVLRAGQISRPLARLKNAALALRKGDLATRVSAQTNLREVALVAYALEDARIALQHTLNQLRQEKAWVDHLLDSIVEGIITIDRHGHITFFSRGAERITGWKQDQVSGKFLDDIFSPLEGNKSFREQIPAPGRKEKIVIQLRNGRQATLAVTGASLAPPEAGKGTALVLRDISDEDAIHRLLGDFLANISHEFRTPLSALAVSTGLLLDQLPDLSQAELHELITSLRLGILSLQTLIDNLLQGASIESGRFRVYPQPINLNEVLAETIALIRPLLDKYCQRLVTALPERIPPVQADPRRTNQVLVNLLSNAIKFSPEGGQINLTVEVGNENVKVRVADQGPGISPEQKPNLFRRFVHIDSDNGRAEYGAGLGLSVVKTIVEAQGGQVGVMDRPGGGAIFWFTLPLAIESPEGGDLIP